jgi:hypothetical protein
MTSAGASVGVIVPHVHRRPQEAPEYGSTSLRNVAAEEAHLTIRTRKTSLGRCWKSAWSRPMIPE